MPGEKKPTVDAILEQYRKKHDLPIGPLSQVLEPVESITTGNLAIDHLIGNGLPRGRSIELFGPPSCGKTTTALQVAARCQDRGEKVLYLDYEQALDRRYAVSLGLAVDADSFLYGSPDDFETGANAARALIETGDISLLVIDSVAGMTPAAIIEAESGAASVALRARMMSQLLQQLNPLLAKTKTTAIFLNHLMDAMDIGGRPGMPKRTTTPGGKSLKYYASVRVEYAQIKSHDVMRRDPFTRELVKVKESQDVKVKVVKNKVGVPFREAMVRVRFGKGFSNEWTALQVLVAHKFIRTGAGGYYFFDKDPELAHPDMGGDAAKPYIQGEPNVLQFADEHPEWAARLVQKATGVVAALGDEGLVSQGDEEPEEDDDPAPSGDLGQGEDIMSELLAPTADPTPATPAPAAPAEPAPASADVDVTAQLLAP